ncbi:MAG: HAD family phosphatase, partial [Demequinaceae bacterium]|nr:HAD family phosphatase [Demequinaceae bacterium]
MRLVGTDIDGTILPRTGVFSPRTIAALGSLADAGIPLVLATARPPRWVDAIASQLGIQGEAVCANGAVFYDLATCAVVDHIGLPEPELLEVAAALRAAFPGVILGLETTTGLAIEPGFPARESNTHPREVARFEDMESVRDLT